jgi:hypothetical protein
MLHIQVDLFRNGKDAFQRDLPAPDEAYIRAVKSARASTILLPVVQGLGLSWAFQKSPAQPSPWPNAVVAKRESSGRSILVDRVLKWV